MTELKTLKDLQDKHSKGEEREIDMNCWEWSDVLKQEAIKWIKEMKPLNSFCMKHGDSAYTEGTNCERECLCQDWCLDGELDGDDCEIEGVIKWIKHFFNITNEELSPKTFLEREIQSEQKYKEWLK